MKKTKSLTIIKMIQNGLINFAKALHIKPNLLYIILGLLAVILISLGLGTQRDGFTSSNDVIGAIKKAVDEMHDAINSINWNNPNDKLTFIKNINLFYNKKMQYLAQGDTTINAFDKGAPLTAASRFARTKPIPDGLVYKLNPEFDISGNFLPRYVDNMVTPDPRKYTLTQTIANAVKQTDLDALMKPITDQINLFSAIEQKKLTNAFNALNKTTDDTHNFITNASTSTDLQPFTQVDKDNILSISSGSPKVDSPTVYSPKVDYEEPNYDKAESALYNAGTIWGQKYSQGYGQGYGQGYKQGYGQGYVQSHSYGQDQLSNFDTYRLSDSNIQRGSNMPPGSEDLYMLKTQALPPSNPPGAAYYGSDKKSDTKETDTKETDTKETDNKRKSNKKDSNKKGFGSSPDLDAYNTSNPSPTQCGCKPAVVPPCPPCERCPEPSFDCKRVPNYNSAAINQYLPQPMLADFSQFGM
jgi:hypothetical protein